MFYFGLGFICDCESCVCIVVLYCVNVLLWTSLILQSDKCTPCHNKTFQKCHQTELDLRQQQNQNKHILHWKLTKTNLNQQAKPENYRKTKTNGKHKSAGATAEWALSFILWLKTHLAFQLSHKTIQIKIKVSISFSNTYMLTSHFRLC